MTAGATLMSDMAVLLKGKMPVFRKEACRFSADSALVYGFAVSEATEYFEMVRPGFCCM